MAKERAPLMAGAQKHYDGLAERLVRSGHALDMFIAALDQTGVLEMQACVMRTGGTFVNCEIFDCDQFRQSYRRSLARSKRNGGLAFASAGSMRVRVSRELRVSGVIGHVSSLGEKEPNVSENEVGVGGTAAWRLCAIEPTSTYAVYFDVVNAHSNPIPPQQLGMVQYQTQYINGAGQHILRITTTAR